MVDREARRQYAQLLRQFVSGRMTNREYEARESAIDAPGDWAIREIASEVWMLYDDNSTHRMTDRHRLDREGRRAIARAVLFLHSDLEYGWPEVVWDGSVFLMTAFLIVLLFALLPETAIAIRVGFSSVPLTLWAWYERVQFQRRRRQQEAAGDADAWPFLRQTELEEAARHPQLLYGRPGYRGEPPPEVISEA